MKKKSVTKKNTKVKSAKKRALSSKSSLPNKSVTVKEDLKGEVNQSYYVLAKHWQSDIMFFKDEISFLHNLLANHFMAIVSHFHGAGKKVTVRLLELEKRRAVLEKGIVGHVHQLVNLIENPFSHDAQVSKDQHGELEQTIRQFTKDFREVKSDIFKRVEGILALEKEKHLLEK